MKTRWAGLLVLVVLAGLTAGAEEPTPEGVVDWRWAEPGAQTAAGDSIYAQATRGARIDDPSTRVFTNAYLEELSRDAAPFATEGSPASDATEARSALDWLFAEQARRQERQARIDEAQVEVDEAQSRLDNLEVQLLATRNPFSRRPRLSEEEIEYRATSGETALERFERTGLLVEEARAELIEAKHELDRARRGR